MKILLDTHIWLWYLFDDPQLSQNLKNVISDSDTELWLSPITIWEVMLLAEKGKLSLPPDPMTWINQALWELESQQAVLNHEIAILSRQLACSHQDPADRFIAATAIHYNLQLATVDQTLIRTPSLQTIH
ncbi:type II toxin-antitoxin system VapC family toxin [Leptolyngbya sp. NIES-2104]|uniref:type II toxin-antitoxin system VapC family toxin n=1 Tax=Leptolyngbya sp. NIES-2104 TaxID=1552121 RepID=UPI00073E95A5|nr:type II toxin-antitoxin system VapC family toxin [Leptolyngbya sp. NIES-2104]